MLIKTKDLVYDTCFQHAQIEITGRCNMSCQHCRAWQEARTDLTLADITKILRFTLQNADTDFRLTLSGGEPFLHPQIYEIVKLAGKLGIKNIIITTNGWLATDQILRRLSQLRISNLCIQVSLDSSQAKTHDHFRGTPGAFRRALSCLKNASRSGLKTSLRATVTPKTMAEIEDLILLARKNGAIRVGIGSVIPAGKGKVNRQLLMNSRQKRKFLEQLTKYKKKYPEIEITTEDPLKFALGDSIWDYGDGDYQQEGFFGGCTAGITGFNVDSSGTITPCAVLLKPITNIKNKTIKQITDAYQNSPIIKKLIKRSFAGKCGSCRLKRLCGGCRAVAEGLSNNYLSSDTTCWLN